MSDTAPIPTRQVSIPPRDSDAQGPRGPCQPGASTLKDALVPIPTRQVPAPPRDGEAQARGLHQHPAPLPHREPSRQSGAPACPADRRPRRLALVSCEGYGASAGGIGTWLRNTAAMMAGRGMEVHVFTARQPGPPPDLGGAHLHLVDAARETFAGAVLAPFTAVHTAAPFDIVEGREYGGDLAAIAVAHPDLPRVVKLATAGILIDEIDRRYLTLAQKARVVAGALRRGRRPNLFWRAPLPDRPGERETTLGASAVSSPSGALIGATARHWPIDLGRTLVVPHAFVPHPGLLRLSPETATQRIVFLGRVEVRKGVLELASAIPRVLEAFPEAGVRFVGRVLPMPGSGRPLSDVIRARLGRHAARVDFTGGLDYAAAMDELGGADIVVLPSHWEAFGFVCLEAMAAARGVVASAAGGMAEIVEHGRTGLLVPPCRPRAIADALTALLADPTRRQAMGRAARDRVLTAYAPDVIAPMQEALYARVLSRTQAPHACPQRLPQAQERPLAAVPG